MKGTILAKAAKLYLPNCLVVDDGLDMLSSIYDSIRATKRVSVVF